MSGTNADGSQYTGPGIRCVSYFSEATRWDAFTGAQYGFPHSDGCVEMELGDATQGHATQGHATQVYPIHRSEPSSMSSRLDSGATLAAGPVYPLR